MYRKLGRETRVRRSILAGLTKDIIMVQSIKINQYLILRESRFPYLYQNWVLHSMF